MGLIISTAHLQKVLPSDASDDNNEITNAVTEATALVNTWTSRHYETWDGYTGTDTSNAPREIVYICTQIAKHLYYQNIGSVTRDGAEEIDHEQRIEYYRQLLEKIDVQPIECTKTINLDDDGYMLIARNQNILPWKAHIVSFVNYSSSSSSSAGLSSSSSAGLSSSVGLSSSSSIGLSSSSSIGLSSSSIGDD
jgi:hypothetical protein